MKLIDALAFTGKPFIIPDCAREELPELFQQLGFTTGVEIGVFRGGFTERLCMAGLKMYAIDPWLPFKGAGRSQQVLANQEAQYEDTVKRLKRYDCEIIRKTSMEAVVDFADQSIDFVYIDGNHQFRYIAEDIFEWTKKVRRGGIVSGHDYFNTHAGASNLICHVKAIVDAYVDIYNLDFYVFGNPAKPTNWMFVRK